jgi:hypothetical protein
MRSILVTEVSMKPWILYLLFTLFCSGVLLQAETVLIFTRNSLNPEREAVAELQSAVEDGVMETFFDAGHIVFNAGIVTDNNSLDVPSERLSLRMAKSGGALYLLEIDLEYLEMEETVAVRDAEYRFYNVLSGAELSSGSLSPEDVTPESGTPQATICSSMGAAIAGGAISRLKL